MNKGWGRADVCTHAVKETLKHIQLYAWKMSDCKYNTKLVCLDLSIPTSVHQKQTWLHCLFTKAQTVSCTCSIPPLVRNIADEDLHLWGSSLDNIYALVLGASS